MNANQMVNAMIALPPSKSPIHVGDDGKTFTIWRNPATNRVVAHNDAPSPGWEWLGVCFADDAAEVNRRWKVGSGTVVFDGIDSRILPSKLFGQFYPKHPANRGPRPEGT